MSYYFFGSETTFVCPLLAAIACFTLSGTDLLVNVDPTVPSFIGFVSLFVKRDIKFFMVKNIKHRL